MPGSAPSDAYARCIVIEVKTSARSATEALIDAKLNEAKVAAAGAAVFKHKFEETVENVSDKVSCLTYRRGAFR